VVEQFDPAEHGIDAVLPVTEPERREYVAPEVVSIVATDPRLVVAARLTGTAADPLTPGMVVNENAR
jgi:hypothetical protein